MTNVREYYRRVTDVDIGEVARDLLGGRILEEGPQRIHCDCPNHASQSRRSLHVMLDKQGWYCFGCGVGGDVLQLVEFVQSGQVTAGQSGPMPETHRRARDHLAEKAGLPTLSRHGLSAERIEELEQARALEVRVQGVLTALARYYHDRLQASPEVLDWLRQKYRLAEETIESLHIGFAVNDAWTDAEGAPRQPVIAALEAEGFAPRELAASGAFRATSQDGLFPFFEKRIIFPYWSRGRVVFLIGRRTPWTPDQPWERGKYKKLPVHNEHANSHIAPCIDNGHLYNEDCLLSRPDRVIITEGVTDCISLMEHGFPAVSPVTIRIPASDWERLLPKLNGVKTVFLCQDEEVSQAGLKGALATARVLAGRDIQTRLVALPLEERQQQARAQLHERFGLDSAVGPKELANRLQGQPEEELEEARQLLEQAKIDVNEYFAAGHTGADYEDLLAEARTPLEFHISRLPTEVTEEERNRALEPVLRGVADLDPLEQNRHLKLIQDVYGKGNLPLGTLKEQVRVYRKETRSKGGRGRRRRSEPSEEAPPGSCRAHLEQVAAALEEELGFADHALLAEAAWNWFTENGARFFHTRQGEPFLFHEDTLFWMDSPDRGRRRIYSALMYRLTGVVHTTTGGRTFYEVLANLAVDRGEERDQFSWIHTDVTGHTVYFNLNNPEHEIARITPDGIDILKNGGNEDGIILQGSPKMQPIHYMPDADPAEADRLVSELVLDNLTCAPGDRLLIFSWLSCFLLIDFTGTRPMTRFEGPSESGKTTASKLISALLYGEPQHKKSTDAANYSDGSRNPLILLDNIEVKQLTDDLVTFILTSITGIAKEKRKSGSDFETVIERTRCLLNTSGIEPLGGELAEVLTRSFIIRFDRNEHAGECFLEAKVLSSIREHRDLILSVMMKRTSQVLACMKRGDQERSMRLLHRTLGDHNKRRCNDYLSLMYLMTIAGEDDAAVEQHLGELHPRFLDQVASLNEVSLETARESNPIATTLASLFQAYRHALQADENAGGQYGESTSNRMDFLQRYQLEFASPTSIRGALARELFVALNRLAKDYNLAFGMKSVQQFAQRFSNDLDTIRQAGFEIRMIEETQRRRTYDIEKRIRGNDAAERAG